MTRNAQYLFLLLLLLPHLCLASILDNASVSYYAKNITTGEILKNEDSEKSLIPASILKVVTTAGAMEILTPEYIFSTKLSYDGTIDEDGTLNGNIYIEGGNDPCLGSVYFMKHYNNPDPFHQWLEAISNLGIKQINGSIISDNKYPEATFYPSSWTIYDKNKNYGTCWNTLSFADNLLSITIIKRNGNHHIVSTYPVLPKNISILINSKNKYRNSSKKVYYDEARHTVVIRHNPIIDNRKITLQVPLTIPEYWLSSMLHEFLIKKGINISSPPAHIPSELGISW